MSDRGWKAYSWLLVIVGFVASVAVIMVSCDTAEAADHPLDLPVLRLGLDQQTVTEDSRYMRELTRQAVWVRPVLDAHRVTDCERKVIAAGPSLALVRAKLIAPLIRDGAGRVPQYPPLRGPSLEVQPMKTTLRSGWSQ